MIKVNTLREIKNELFRAMLYKDLNALCKSLKAGDWRTLYATFDADEKQLYWSFERKYGLEMSEKYDEVYEMPVYRCAICKEVEVGYGNNAQPVADGRCCDDCNDFVVIPVRKRVW